MNKNMYRRLALQNINNNKNTFFPFGLSVIVMCAMFYMLSAIQSQVGDQLYVGADNMRMILNMGVYVCGIFSLIVIFYTNSFLMKRRTKELGLYSILGMEKKHINKVVFWEMYITGIVSIVAGLFFGVLFSRFMYLILLKLLRLKGAFVYKFVPESVVLTSIIFVGIFVLLIFVNMIRIQSLRPIDLMSGARKGEREPKANWLLAIIAVICLSIGYCLALRTSNPMEALGLFFVAVLFVIAGTYLLFISGSVALLKLLKHNKHFFYQKNHFISVSGMMYRMKQNAVGLANICILSTMVLVVISATVSLYVGNDNALRTRYPSDVMTEYLYREDMKGEELQEGEHYDYTVLAPAVADLAKQYDVTIKNEQQYYDFSCVGSLRDQTFCMEYNMADLVYISIVTPEFFSNRGMVNLPSIKDGEALYYMKGNKKIGDRLQIGNNVNLTLEHSLDKAYYVEEYMTYSYDVLFLVVKDIDTLACIRDEVNAMDDSRYEHNVGYHYNFDLAGKMKQKTAFCRQLRDTLKNTKIAHISFVENIYTVKQEFLGIYGGLFFVGIFVGTLFLMTTVLIIYYKQISEGYDDYDRFVILKKVGMSSAEIRKTISTQVRMVFFLPMILAIVHMSFAFDIIRKILLMLNLSNWMLFVYCTIATVLVFFVVYAIVYRMTARSYYRIVMAGNTKQ